MSETNWDCDCCWQTVNPNREPHTFHDVYGDGKYLQAYHLECYKKFQDIFREGKDGVWNGVDPN